MQGTFLRVYTRRIFPVRAVYSRSHHTGCETCNSLIYKDKQVRLEWLSTCHIEDDPAVGWGNQLTGEELKMNDKLLKLSVKMQTLLVQEEGQDLIEYALVVALIAFAAVTSMKTLANDINQIFLSIGTALTTAG
jgi:pilus assembly protein Flp/PilA